MPVFDNAFYEITALLLVAAVVGALTLRLRQPLIVAFIAIGIAVGLAMRYLLPQLLHQLARSPEMQVLAWVAIASTPYREAISTRLATLRDFLLLFFFVSLGAQLDLQLLGTQLMSAMVFSLYVLIGNPLIVMAIIGVMGYRKRAGFLAGLTVTQISEFSLVFAALGLTLSHIGANTLGFITLVGLVTIGLSTYMILYSHPLYDRLAPYLGIFERRVPHREQTLENHAPPLAAVDVILFGIGRYGDGIAQRLRDQDLSVLGVDFDPQAIRSVAQSIN